MDFSYQHAQSQRVLRQRNMLGITAIVLAGIVALLLLFSANRDREAVLLPILDGPLRVSSSGVTREYLELVTRDTAVLTLNRTPNSLDYWMKQVLAIVSPKSQGAIKADLLKIVDDQRGSSITTEAARVVVAFGFENLGLPVLTSGYFEDNPASGGVLRKLGFVETGRVMRPCLAVGGEVPSVTMKLTHPTQG